MNTSARSDNLSGGDLALPLAAVISLAITSYVVVVLAGEYRLIYLSFPAEISL